MLEVGSLKGDTTEQAMWSQYGRQLALPEWGEGAQRRLQSARVLLVGVGGLGSAVATYLVAAGVGVLEISDDDQVSLSNLQRQFLYGVADLGQRKTHKAMQRLTSMNPRVRIHSHPAVHADTVVGLLTAGEYQLVVDCCDNQATRLMLNQACLQLGVPLLSAAASGWLGSLALFDFSSIPLLSRCGCYACLYPQAAADDCRQIGILGATVGIVGACEALEALKFLGGLPTPAATQVLRFNALDQRWQQLGRQRDPACLCCSEHLTKEATR